MALYSVATGDTIQAADVNQFKNALEGALAVTWLLVAAANTDINLKMADAAGSYKVKFVDSAGATVASVDSDGNALFTSINLTTLTLPTSATPSQTTDAQIIWDSDDDLITVGTGSATKRFGLVVASGPTASVKGEMVYDTATRVVSTHDGTSSIGLTPLVKDLRATQSRNDTVFTTVTDGTLTWSFAIAANEVWVGRVHLMFVFTGTGGLKMQLTGPAAPTAVKIAAWSDGMEAASDPLVHKGQALVTAFSSSFFGVAAAAGSDGSFPTGNTSNVWLDVYIANGANAGTITIDFAQQAANGTTVAQVGSTMEFRRVR